MQNLKRSILQLTKKQFVIGVIAAACFCLLGWGLYCVHQVNSEIEATFAQPPWNQVVNMPHFTKEAAVVVECLERYRGVAGSYPESQTAFDDLLTSGGISNPSVGSGRWIYRSTESAFEIVVPELGGESMQYPCYYYYSESMRFGYDS